MEVALIVLATIFVVLKLYLEHQKSIDASNGVADSDESYTVKGLLQSMRNERKADKIERKIEKQEKKLEKTKRKL